MAVAEKSFGILIQLESVYRQFALVILDNMQDRSTKLTCSGIIGISRHYLRVASISTTPILIIATTVSDAGTGRSTYRCSFGERLPRGRSLIYRTWEACKPMHLDLVSVYYGRRGKTREGEIFSLRNYCPLHYLRASVRSTTTHRYSSWQDRL